jgi:copper oxidase (laccase) domain-containing protein
MSERRDGEICVLRSPTIPAEGFRHGFPTRNGGISIGLRRSLNLGYRWGDDKAESYE